VIAPGAGLSPASAQPKAESRPQSEYPVATDARIEQSGETVRLSMMLSSSVAVDAWVQAAPDRVIVELPSTNFQIQPSAKRSAGFVSGYRYGLFTADKARIIIDLSQPATIAKAEVKMVRGGFGELTIELKKAARADFLAEAGKVLKPGPVAPLPAPAMAASIPVRPSLPSPRRLSSLLSARRSRSSSRPMAVTAS
jgi:N-acetylmuramoyl-L-alanine amidase